MKNLRDQALGSCSARFFKQEKEVSGRLHIVPLTGFCKRGGVGKRMDEGRDFMTPTRISGLDQSKDSQISYEFEIVSYADRKASRLENTVANFDLQEALGNMDLAIVKPGMFSEPEWVNLGLMGSIYERYKDWRMWLRRYLSSLWQGSAKGLKLLIRNLVKRVGKKRILKRLMQFTVKYTALSCLLLMLEKEPVWGISSQTYRSPMNWKGQERERSFREIVFVDSAVDDPQTLISSIPNGPTLVMLDPYEDGIKQISDVVSGFRDIEAIHIISHGAPGRIFLGNAVLSEKTVKKYTFELEMIGHSLGKSGDILFYGCDVAANKAGTQLLNKLAITTGADVAFSDDRTARADLGGDFELEIRSGKIEATSILKEETLEGYDHSLATITVTNTNDSGAGSLRQAISDASAGDTITFATGLAGQTVTLTSGELTINKQLTIDGDLNDNGSFSSGDDITISGNNASRVLNITGGSSGNEVSLFGLQLQDGVLAGNGGTAGFGGEGGDALGAAINNSGFLLMDHMVITQNRASGGGGGGDAGSGNFGGGGGGGGAGASGTGGSGGSGKDQNTLLNNGGSASGSTGGNGGIATGRSGTAGAGGSTAGGSGAGNGGYSGATATINGTNIIGGGGGGTTYKSGLGGYAGGGYAGGRAVAGVYNSGTLTINNTVFTQNAAAGGGGSATHGGMGVGGIYTGSSATLKHDGSSASNFTGSSVTFGSGATENAGVKGGGTGGTYGTSHADYSFRSGGTVTPNTDLVDGDGSLGASGTVSEPVALPTTATATGSAVNLFDFTFSDGGGGDGVAMTVSQIVLNTSGTGDFSKVTWRLNGPDVSNVTGTYSSGANTITFSGLSISVANGNSETYTVNAYYNDNTGLTEGQTFILSVDGDTGLTVGSSGTQMATRTAVTNSTGSTVDVAATKLVFTTQPSPLTGTSGSAIDFTTDPVVTAQDAAGNTDTGFTSTVTLAETGSGSATYNNNSVAAAAGVATFTGLTTTYTATADQETFGLQASGGSLTTATSSNITSDVVATKLVFTAQPSPLTGTSGSAIDFTTDPVVEAQDANNVKDAGFTSTVTLAETGSGSATYNNNSVAAVAGVATFTGLTTTYTATADQETFGLQASGGSLTTATSNNITSDVVATKLAFTTQPAGSVSGSVLTTQPVVTAQDANGTTDTGQSGSVALAESSAGSLSGTTSKALSSGVATFTDVVYTATADQQTFALTGSLSGLTDATSNNVTSDVVATKLVFTTQPAPLTGQNLETLDFTTDPVVTAQDANDLTDTGFTDTVTLTETGAGSATYSNNSVAAVAGVATFTGLTMTYTAAGTTAESVGLQADDTAGGAEGNITTLPTSSTITIIVNRAAVPTAATETTLEDTDKTIALSGTDADNDALTGIISALPTKGALYQTSDGTTRGVQITSVPTTVTDGSRRVIYAPVANENGTTYTTFGFKLNDGTIDSDQGMITIDVTAVNDIPTLSSISDVTILEDASTQTVNLSGIGTGQSNESQTLSVTASSNNTSLIPNPTVSYTSANATGTLSFTPVAHQNGSAVITVTVSDDGGTSNSGVNTVSQTFTVNVTAVNDIPTLSSISDVTILEDASNQTVSLSGIGTGQSNESQTLSVIATSNNTSLIPNPSVTYTSANSTGSISFTPEAHQNGSATITVTVTDDGGTSNSGVNTVSQTFTVNVTAVNDIPTLSTISDVTILEDAGAQTVSLSGIGTGQGNESQALSVTASSSNTSLIPDPTVSYTSADATGSISFTPVAHQNGSAVITVTVTDNGGTSNSGVHTVSRTFTVNVTAVNDVPTLSAISDVTILEDVGAQTVSLSGIGTGQSNESQTLSVAASSSNTSLVPNPTVSYTSANTTGSLLFTPVAHQNGSATITVTVSDDGGTSNSGVNTVSQTFTVTVTGVNDMPTLSAISDVTILEDASAQTVSLSGIGTGQSNELQTLSVTASSNNTSLIPDPTVSYTSANTTGSLNFTPVAHQSGSATITVTVSDDGGTSNSGVNTVSQTFTVAVTPVNDVPTLSAISDVMILEDASTQTVSLSGIGSGQSNESQTLSVSAVSSNTSLIPNPTVSYTSANTTGSLSFVPVAHQNGSATITVTVSDDGGTSNSGVNRVSQTFTVTVTGVNDVPTLSAIGDPAAIDEDASEQTVSLVGIGMGQSNEGQTLTVTASSNNTALIPNPTVTYTSPNATGTLTYTPIANAHGSAMITVTVNDGGGTANSGMESVSQTFTVSVNAVEDAPVGQNDSFSIQEDTPTALSVLANDSEPDGDTFSINSVTGVSNGTTTVNSNGTITFAPDNNFAGQAGFSYVTADNKGNLSNTATVTITVIAINDSPVAGDDAAETQQGVAVSLNVLDNDSDPEGLPVVLASVATPENGSASINGSSIVFTPNADFFGTETFTYRVTTNEVTVTDDTNTATGTITVVVIRDNVAPVAVEDAVSLDFGTAFVNVDVLANDTDADGDGLSLTSIGSASHGTAVVNSNGSVNYRPNSGYTGQDQFAYTIDDGFGAQATGTVVITVQPPPGAPVANDDTAETSEELAVSISILSNDSDEGVPGLRVTTVGTPSQGTAALNEDNTVTYTPNTNFAGEDTFTYSLTNDSEQSTSATVIVTVNNLNDAPEIRDLVQQAGVENQTFTLDLSPFAFDVDNTLSQLRWEVVEIVAPVEAASVDGHNLTVNPLNLQAGIGTVQLKLVDFDGAEAQADLQIDFADVNFSPIFTESFSPSDQATDVAVRSRSQHEVTLAWDASDLDTPALTYSIRMGSEANVLNTVGSDLSTPSWILETALSQTWFWQVVVSDGTTTIESAVMSFTVQGDTFAPILTADVQDIRTTSARVRGAIDETSTWQVWTAVSGGTLTQTASGDGTAIDVELTSLQDNTTYVYEVVATDAADNESRTGERTFNTLRAPDVSPPQFATVPEPSSVGDTGGSVKIVALEPVTVAITVNGDGESKAFVSDIPALEHVITLSGLTASTFYQMLVAVTDGAGNVTTNESSFTTSSAPDTQVPVFVRRPDVTVTHNRATIIWEVNEATTGTVRYGLTADALTEEISSSTNTTHGVDILNLSANTIYFCKVIATDIAGNVLESDVVSFTTLTAPDVIAPEIVEGPSVRGIAQDQATVVWQTDEPAFSFVIFDSLSLSTRSFETPQTSELATSHSHRLTGLGNNTIYTYQVISIDGSGNRSNSAGATFQTLLGQDTTPPVLVSSPVVSDLGFDRMTVQWETDEAASSEVTLTALTTAKQAGNESPIIRNVDADLVISHTVLITGLAANISYEIVVVSRDADNNIRLVNLGAVRTLNAPDTTSPEILGNPILLGVTDTRATVSWTVNEPTDGFVLVDTLADMSTARRVGNTNPAQQHEVTLTNLLPDKTYYFKVSSQDVAGNASTVRPLDNVLTFQTQLAPDVLPPVILEGPVAVSPTDQTVQIVWKTNEQTDARVRYGTSSNALSDESSVFSADRAQDHSLTLTGLVANTEYFYEVVCFDGAGNGPTVSGIRSFTTEALSDTQPPVVISGPAAVDVTPTSALIVWETDEASTSEVDVNGRRFGRSESVRSHRVQITDLIPNSRVNFTVISTDASGNTLRRVDGLSFQTISQGAVEPPSILEGPWVQYVTNMNAVIGWVTNKPTTSEVFFGRVESFGPQSARQTSQNLTREHSFTLTNLDQSADYAFRVVSTDASGNQVVAGNLVGFVAKPGVLTKFAPGEGGSFATGALPDTRAPEILKGPNVVSSTPSTLTIEWTTDESSDSGIDFGVTDLATRVEDGVDVQTHRIVVTNLLAGTTYQYRVLSTDPSDNGPATSSVFLATTQAVEDKTAPRLEGPPSALKVTDRSAVLGWTTDERSVTFVEYGTDELDNQEATPDYVTGHQVTLTGLNPQTIYKFRVRAVDQLGNGPTQSEILTFTTEATPDVVPPVISGAPEVTTATETYAIIRWATDELSDSVVRFGLDETLGQSIGSARDVVDHEVVVNNLSANTTYQFVIESTDRSGNGPVTSQVLTFTTAGAVDSIGPATPTNLRTRSGNRQAYIAWDPVGDGDLIGYRVLRAAPGQEFSSIATLIEKPEYVDDGLDAGVTYRYVIHAVDQAVNLSGASDEVSVSPNGADIVSAPMPLGNTGSVTQAILTLANVASTLSLTYNFEIATDSTFATVIGSASGVSPGTGTSIVGGTGWQVDVLLEEQRTYYWRAWAFDGTFDGVFMSPQVLTLGAFPGDFNQDLVVNFEDFLLFIPRFDKRSGESGYVIEMDLTTDGVIDFADFLSFIRHFDTDYRQASGQ